MEKYGKLVDWRSNRFRNVDLEPKALRTRGTLKPSSLIYLFGSQSGVPRAAASHHWGAC